MPCSKLPTPPTAAADVRMPSHAPSDAPSHAPSQALAHPSATLEAVLERITYANEETGYTVARVSARGVTSSGELLTVVGNPLGAQPGESLRPQGRRKG